MNARERARRAVSEISDGRATVTIKPSRLEDLVAREIRNALDEVETEILLKGRQAGTSNQLEFLRRHVLPAILDVKGT